MSTAVFFAALAVAWIAGEVSRSLAHRREMQRLKFLADRETLRLLDAPEEDEDETHE